MYLAKISSSGQITIPLEVRRALNLKPGGKVLFIQNERGQFAVENASTHAIYSAQAAFEGAAEKMGVANEEDVQTLVNEIRYGI